MTMSKIIGAIAGLVFSTTALHADDIDDRVRKIAFFTTADAVLALMQRQPDATESFKLATIPAERWRWSTANGRTVVVTMVEDHVVMTKVCTAVASC
jgi:hypothetical protein